MTSRRLNSEEAAKYLGFTANTMRWSRSIGKLAGVEHPRYKKIGRKVSYDLESLDEWLAQFKEQTNTAQDV
ncbi:helix-turn-helix domain-containing protein [Porticoccus sp. GXU_MW_L64]